MKPFEEHLERELRQHGWSHEETFELPDHWWAACAWRIRSTKANFGYELLLTFIGHYQDGNEVNLGDPVGQIIASDRIPADHTLTSGLPELLVDAHDYPQRVVAFVDELDEWRRGQPEATQAEQAEAPQFDPCRESKSLF